MKRTRAGSRILFLGFLVLVSMGAITWRLWEVQVLKGSEYASRVSSGSQVTVRLPANVLTNQRGPQAQPLRKR